MTLTVNPANSHYCSTSSYGYILNALDTNCNTLNEKNPKFFSLGVIPCQLLGKQRANVELAGINIPINLKIVNCYHALDDNDAPLTYILGDFAFFLLIACCSLYLIPNSVLSSKLIILAPAIGFSVSLLIS